MKLRLRGDSLRLRLSQSDVACIERGEAVIETTNFAQSTLRYSLHPSDGVACEAYFVDGAIQVRVPSGEALRWAQGTAVGIEVQVGSLAVLIEKDFACLEPRAGAEDGDTFPNPKAVKR